jgi:hypothetical protein
MTADVLSRYLAERRKYAEGAKDKSVPLPNLSPDVHRHLLSEENSRLIHATWEWIADARNSQETLIRMVALLSDAIRQMVAPHENIENPEGYALFCNLLANKTFEAVEQLAQGGDP